MRRQIDMTACELGESYGLGLSPADRNEAAAIGVRERIQTVGLADVAIEWHASHRGRRLARTGTSVEHACGNRIGRVTLCVGQRDPLRDVPAGGESRQITMAD